MIVKDLLSLLKKAKAFAKENSAIDWTKNVQILGSDTYLSLYCCDGESAIWIEEPIGEGIEQSITGMFCINIFNLFKIIKTLPEMAEVKIKARRDSIVISSQSAKMTMNTVPPENILMLKRQSEWKEIDKSFFEIFRLVSSTALDEQRPIAFDGKKIHHSSATSIVYAFAESNCLPSFKVSPKTSEKMYVDQFDKIAISDRTICLKNETCEVCVVQSGIPAIMIDPLIDSANRDYPNKVAVEQQDLKHAYDTIVQLREIGKLDDKVLELSINSDGLVLGFRGSEFKVKCKSGNENVSTNFRLSIDHIKALVLGRNSKEDDELSFMFASKVETMFVASRGTGIFYIGGLSR